MSRHKSLLFFFIHVIMQYLISMYVPSCHSRLFLFINMSMQYVIRMYVQAIFDKYVCPFMTLLPFFSHYVHSICIPIYVSYYKTRPLIICSWIFLLLCMSLHQFTTPFFPICSFKICSSTCFLQKPPPVIICSSIFIQFCLSPHRNMPLFHDTFMNIYSVMYVSSWVTRLVSLYIHILVISDAFLMSPHDFLSVPHNLLIIYVLPCPLPFSMPLGSCISFILHSC